MDGLNGLGDPLGGEDLWDWSCHGSHHLSADDRNRAQAKRHLTGGWALGPCYRDELHAFDGWLAQRTRPARLSAAVAPSLR